MGGRYRTNSSNDSMLDANVSIGDYLSAITLLASTASATTVTALVASVVNPARAMVGLEAAAGISSLSLLLSANRQRSTGSPNKPDVTGINREGVGMTC